MLRRLGLIVFVWLLVTGAEFRCSFNSDPDDDRPDRPPEDNRAPVASDAAYAVLGNQELNGLMPATDPDGDVLTWRVESGPSLGSIRDLDSRRGTFTYVPGATGADSFSFRASDGRLDSNAASVRIAVQPASVAVDQPVVRLVAGPGAGEVLAKTGAGEWLHLNIADGRQAPVRPGMRNTDDPLPRGALMSASDPAGGGRVAVFGPTPTLVWSDNGGATWQAARVPPGLRPVAVSRAGEGRFAAVARDAAGVRVLVSRDQGRTWQAGPGWPGVAGRVMSAILEPGGGMVVFLASAEGTTIWMARTR